MRILEFPQGLHHRIQILVPAPAQVDEDDLVLVVGLDIIHVNSFRNSMLQLGLYLIGLFSRAASVTIPGFSLRSRM